MKYYIFILFSFFSSLLYSQSKKNTDSISYYNKQANINLKEKKYEKAIELTKKSIEYCRDNKQPENLANQTFKLGKIYYNQKKYDEALLNFHKTITLFKNINPNCTTALALHYIGIINATKKDYQTSEIYYQKTDSLFKVLKLNDPTEDLNYQKAIVLKDNKKFISASKIFKKIIAKPNNTKNLKTKTDSYYQLGLIETKLHQNNLAITYFENALELTRKSGDLKQKSKIILAISQHYKNKKDYDRAFTYLEQHYQLENHLLKLKNAKLDFDEYQKLKDNENITNELKRKSDEKVQVKTYRYSKLISILAIALISILSLLSLALYKNNIIRNQSNLLLREKNKELILAKNKAEQASKARSEFLSTVSHELRTPLNAINGITHLLLEDKPNKSQLKYLESLKFSGNYLTTFINEILEINKIDSTKIEIENINFDLKNLLINIQCSLKELAIVNKNYFNLEIDDSIPDN